MQRMRVLDCLMLPLLPMVMVCAGCALASGTMPLAAEPYAIPPTMTSAADRSMPAELGALWPAMLEDAARRSGLPAATLHAASVQAVIWPDGSLGCPQPGRMYTQALVPGWRVVIAAPGAASRLQYHVSQRGTWLWCPADRATPALPASPDPRI